MSDTHAERTAQVIHADWMLTPGGAIADAELAFDAAGLITYAGPRRQDSVADLVLDGHALMPGLVNGHTHSAMTLLRGSSDDEGFMPWLDEVQALEQHLTHDDVATGLQLAMLEMIESGMPIDLLIYRTDTFEIGEQRRIRADDPYFRKLSEGWSRALRTAFANIESYTNTD